MTYSTLLVLVCVSSSWVAQGIKIDNELSGDPVVECQDTMVSLTFTTEKPFTGRVYVKGLADDDRCSRNFATNIDQNKFNMMVQNGDCAMARQRVSGALEGLMFSLTVVVSFHGTFVTKVDRAYRCMCFFQNIKRVTNILDISAIGTTALLDTAKMPTCSYSIHSGAPDGPLLRYGKVGDKIYHSWECDDEAQGFLVHSCWVNDGRGQRFDLLDIDGCAVDPIIQADIKYDTSLTKAHVETHGYKFSDTSVLNYQCVLELCKKAQGECDSLTPPKCGRGKRSVDTILVKARKLSPEYEEERIGENVMDVVASVDILDTLQEEVDADAAVPDRLIHRLNGGESMFHPRSGLVHYQPSQQMCLSSPAFGIMVSISVILFFTAVITSSLLCFRIRYEK